MIDKETRAHDFAIAVVSSYQNMLTQSFLDAEKKPRFEIDELVTVYCNAYEEMLTELENDEA